MAQLKKADLIKILVDEYGYETADLKFNSEGKPFTNAALQAMIKAEEVEAKELERESTRIVAPKSILKDSDKILVMNGLPDVLVYRSERTNRRWQFERFGAQDTMEYGELITLKNRYPNYFYDGWLIVLDKTVQDEFGLTEMYKNILTPQSIDEALALSNVDELEKLIDALPAGMKKSLINRAVELYHSNKLDSVAVVKFLQSKFNFSFEDYAPLGDIAASTDTGVYNVIYVDKN